MAHHSSFPYTQINRPNCGKRCQLFSHAKIWRKPLLSLCLSVNNFLHPITNKSKKIVYALLMSNKKTPMTTGMRLKQFRKEAGFASITDLYRASLDTNYPLVLNRLYKIEKDVTIATDYESLSICNLLNVSADCLRHGICNTPADILNQHCKDMNKDQRGMLLQLAAAQAGTIKKEWPPNAKKD